MPSKLMTESNRYKAQLKSMGKDNKVTQAEADALVREAKKGDFTEVKAHYLVGFLGQYGDKFEPGARATITQFLKSDVAKNARIEAETGGPLKGGGQPKITTSDAHAGNVTFTEHAGKVSVGGFGADDPMQGALGDCYLLSSLSAVAQSHPELLKNAITTNRDGTYTVTFFERADMSKPATKEQVTIDGKFAMKDGQFEYAAAREPSELWPQIFEKAYAAWKGSFGKIEGGMGADALEALTGAKPGFTLLTPDLTPAQAFAAVKAALADKGCVVALSQPFHPTEPGLVADHAYTLLGTEEKDGQQLVKLRNPWGSGEPGADGKDDGVFTLPVEKFIKAYTMIEYARP